MKAFRLLSLLGLVVVLFTYSGCGGGTDPEPPISEVQFGKLAKTWKVNTVSFNSEDRTADYTNFQLVISGTKTNTSFDYTTSGRPALSPWKASGKWEFGTSAETQIIRDKGTEDELTMTYAVTESTLSITFNFSKDGYSAKTGVVKGPWVFNFKL